MGYFANRCPKCNTPMEKMDDPDRHPRSRLCPGCDTEALLGQTVIQSAKNVRQQLAEAREENPKACYYLACQRCFQYIPEQHADTTAWTKTHQTREGKPCHGYGWNRQYQRFVDPEEQACVPVELGLPPLEALAWVGKQMED